LTRSNRTIVGLKLLLNAVAQFVGIRSNRTIVGLKHGMPMPDGMPMPAAIAPLWD